MSAERLIQGSDWELELAQRLEAWGWSVAPWGMGTLPGAISRKNPQATDIARAVRDFRDMAGRPSLLRWMPDMICARDHLYCLIDAKSETRPSANYAIERSALETGRILTENLIVPVFYCWQDGGVLSPELVAASPHTHMDGSGAHGSGTPFVLVSKSYAASAACVFGYDPYATP